MEFTEEELKWIHKDRPQLGDMLDELNQRARSYVNYSSLSVKKAQEKAMEDFKNHVKPGQYVEIQGAPKEGPFFEEAKK